MAIYTCPDDPTHKSSDAHVCTICGALIEDSGPVTVPKSGTPTIVPKASGATCPNCGVPRRSGMLFCENCGVDFATGSLDVPDAAPAPTPTPAPVPVAAAPAAAPAPVDFAAPSTAVLSTARPTNLLPHTIATPTLEAVVSIDTSDRERPDDATVPADQHERIYLLDGDRLLIGRGSSSIHPQIVLRDDGGVSRGHAELIRQRDGNYAVRDLGSANGTLVNGQNLDDQQLRPLGEGDKISIGFWHLITLRSCH